MGTVPVAVSMTTESSDHYLHLLHVISVEHFIEECKKWMDDEQDAAAGRHILRGK